MSGERILTAFLFCCMDSLLSYSQAAPTIINKINRTTINANPPPYAAPPILTPPLKDTF